MKRLNITIEKQPHTPNSKQSITRNEKQETKNHKPKTTNNKPQTINQKQAKRNHKLEKKEKKKTFSKILTLLTFSTLIFVVMIGFLRGNFVEKTPAKLIIDVNGVGYEVHISLTTYEAIMSKESGQLYIYWHITEIAQTLFGFFEAAEKELFLQLISVSGVGAATARMMLSSSKPTELIKFIVEQNVNELVKIKGIGKKTAELLVVSLKDKLKPISIDNQIQNVSIHQPKTDAINALIALGIAKPVAEKAVTKVVMQTENLELQEIIKQALKNI